MAQSPWVRWVVRNGTQFYASNSFNTINNTVTSNTIESVATIAWQTYNPSSLANIFFNSGAPAPYTDFQNITALGFYVSSEDAIFNNNDIDLLISQFQVTATTCAVPEPGFAMVGLFGVGLFAVRRLKSRKSKSSAVSAEFFPVVPEAASALQVSLR